MKDDIFYRPLVIFGSKLCGLNVCKPSLSSAGAQLSSNQYLLCVLSEWEGQGKRNIQFSIHVNIWKSVFANNLTIFRCLFKRCLENIHGKYYLEYSDLYYTTHPIKVTWTLILICICNHLDSEFSLLFGSYLQRRRYIKNPSLVFSCDGKKFAPLHLHIYTQIIE